MLKQKGNQYVAQNETDIPAKKVVLSGDVYLDTSGFLRDCRKMENGHCLKNLPNVNDFQGYLYSTTDNKVFRIETYDATPFRSQEIFNGSQFALGKEKIMNVYDSYAKEGLYHYAIILSNKTLLMGGNNNGKSTNTIFTIKIIN